MELQVFVEFEREQSGASGLMLELIVGLSRRLASAWLLSTDAHPTVLFSMSLDLGQNRSPSLH